MNIFDEIEHLIVSETIYGCSGHYGPRMQTGILLVYLYSGSVRITVDRKKIQVRAGEMILMTPGHMEDYAFSEEEETHHGWCGAFSRNPDKPFEALAGLEGAICPLPPMVRLLTDRCIALRNQAAPSAKRLYRQLALSILHEYFHATGFWDEDVTPLPEPIRKACEWMDVHYAEDCSLDGLARAAGVTGPHLIRLFKQHVGQTPVRRLWTVRCESGKRMLAETGLSIAEVAWRCGYKTPYHFSRDFKSRFGVSPRAYRTDIWSGGNRYT